MTPPPRTRYRRGGDSLRFTDSCHLCGVGREIGERFSPAGLCASCAELAMIENRRQLRAHSGPLFDHWRRRCLAAFGVVEREPAGD